nr:pathogenesis-related protein 5-like [Leptinotarsa decemlineata]
MFKSMLTTYSMLTAVLAVEFQITNKERGPIQVGFQGNNGKPALENGGFILEQDATRSVWSESNWAGRIWARTWCDYNTKHCLTGDFNQLISNSFQIEPIGGKGDGGQYSCKKSACPRYLNDECPNELKLNTEHGVVGCKSACLAFNTDQYCCRGAFGTPETCRSSTWPVNYPKFFKSRCPDAYSYAYDDHKSTFTCRAEKYLITFGL